MLSDSRCRRATQGALAKLAGLNGNGKTALLEAALIAIGGHALAVRADG
jgi:recombinational DNA repair ATPase RecF